MNEDEVNVGSIGEAMGGVTVEAGMSQGASEPDVIGGIFGDGRITYDEFLIKAAEAGVRVGDVGEVEGRYELKLREVRCNAALERELDRSGAKSREIVSKVIDMSKVTVSEDGVYGLAEQFTELKKSAPYLFSGAEEKEVVFSSGLNHGNGIADADSLDDGEYYRKVKRI